MGACICTRKILCSGFSTFINLKYLPEQSCLFYYCVFQILILYEYFLQKCWLNIKMFTYTLSLFPNRYVFYKLGYFLFVYILKSAVVSSRSFQKVACSLPIFIICCRDRTGDAAQARPGALPTYIHCCFKIDFTANNNMNISTFKLVYKYI
jgi:hypothetical protein